MPRRVRIVGAVIAVLLVSSGVALLLAVRGQEADGGVAAAPSASTSRKVPTPTLSSLPTSLATVDPSPTAPQLPSPRPAGPQALQRPPLTVLNNSTISGLGADAAARFRAAGWTIADIRGISGRYRYSTVYYDPGQIEAARTLMRQFPAISVIEPRLLYPNLPGRGLTVVVTRDFA